MQLQLTGQITGIEARNGGWFAVAFQEQGSNYPKKLSTKKMELVQQAQQMMGQWADALYNESESTNINPNNGQPYMNRFLEALAMAGSMPQQAPQQPQPGAYPYPMPPAPQPVAQPQFQGQPQGFAGQPASQPFVPQPAPIMQQQPQQVPNIRISDDLREQRIMRQAAGKVAAGLLPMLGQEDQNLASLIRISEQLVQYFRDGVQWTTNPVQPQQRTPQQEWQADPDAHPNPQAQQQHQGGDPGPQPGDPYHAPQAGGVDSYDDIPFTAAIW